VSAGTSAVTLRPATLGDAEMVFCWRNDPFLVMRGSSQKTVTWKEHLQWFQATVSGSERKMFIVLVGAEPAGQVRFDRVNNETCKISAYLLQSYTGRGLGVEAIRRGCEVLFRQWGVSKIVACIREDNKASRVAFGRAGFVESSEDGLCPKGHFTFVQRSEVCPDSGSVRS